MSGSKAVSVLLDISLNFHVWITKLDLLYSLVLLNVDSKLLLGSCWKSERLV